MTPLQTHHAQIAEHVIKQLKRRNMEGFFCQSCEEAQELVSSLISPNSSVTFGGSVTLMQTGILTSLEKRKDLTIFDRAKAQSPEEISKIYRKAFSCDAYLMSSNAITRDGELINIDGNGNRAAALIYGPSQVLVIVGVNKICLTLEDAFRRARNTAAPANCLRLQKQTPCASTGSCEDCQSWDCICAQTVITRRSLIPGRIKVILLEGNWGY